jgi:hypothetical protein
MLISTMNRETTAIVLSSLTVVKNITLKQKVSA